MCGLQTQEHFPERKTSTGGTKTQCGGWLRHEQRCNVVKSPKEVGSAHYRTFRTSNTGKHFNTSFVVWVWDQEKGSGVSRLSQPPCVTSNTLIRTIDFTSLSVISVCLTQNGCQQNINTPLYNNSLPSKSLKNVSWSCKVGNFGRILLLLPPLGLKFCLSPRKGVDWTDTEEDTLHFLFVGTRLEHRAFTFTICSQLSRQSRVVKVHVCRFTSFVSQNVRRKAAKLQVFLR